MKFRERREIHLNFYFLEEKNTYGISLITLHMLQLNLKSNTDSNTFK